MYNKYDIFISYHSKDREWVRRLVDALLAQGLRVWYDEMEIKFGDTLPNRMEEGLRQSAYVVFIITPETVRSNWMALELGAALALQKPLIPIVAEETPFEDIPGPIKLRMYLIKSDPLAIAEQIARGIITARETEESPTVA